MSPEEPSTEKTRQKEVIEYLLKHSDFKKKNHLSLDLGYTSASGLSEVYSQKVYFNKAAKTILHDKYGISLSWLEYGKGDMLEEDSPLKKSFVAPKQTETLQQYNIVPIVLDESEKEYITYVPVPAQAGFAREYPKTDYVKRLPHFSIPNYHNGSALAFSVEGDSMSPTLRPNNIVIAEPVEKPDWIDPKGIHVIIADRGTLIKRFIYHKDLDYTGDDNEENKGFLEWISDNDFYNTLPLHQRAVPISEVKHIFKVVMKIGRDMPAPDETLKLIKEILTKVDAIARRDINI